MNVVVAGVLAVVVGVAVVAVPATGERISIRRSAGGPTVNVAAFAHHGRLAFVSRNSLWVLDGTRRSLRRIVTTPGLHPLHPSFSRDGKWLAYVETDTAPANSAGGATDDGQVWLARGDGSDAHPLPDLRKAHLVGWSPVRDVLAAVAGPVSTRVPFGALTTLRLVTPGGSVRLLLHARSVKGAVWSPDGRQLAVVTEAPRLVDTLAVYPVAGGAPTVWRRFHPHDHLNGMSQILVAPVGWWRGFGIGFWVYGDGATRNNDETPLDVIRAPGARPRFLAETLSDQVTRVVAAGGEALAVVADVSHGINGGRDVWDAKQLQVCRPLEACRPIAVDRSKVTLDPEWSPSGNELAFVEAPDLNSSGWQQRVVKHWYAQHVLRLYDRRTRRVRELTAARSATAPLWSSDGESLLYVARDGVWLLPSLTANPVRVATPLFEPSFWPSYFGQMAWPAQLSWWSG